MLNAVNIAFVVFARLNGAIAGQVIVLFVMIVAAAEVAEGLAIIVLIFRRRHSSNVDDLSLMRW
jgi:NADH-quinone oxidoreductase subunit K